MAQTKNDLADSVGKEINQLLNARLSDLVDLKTQVKQAHWNVKGPHFIGLHLLFDDIAAAVDGYVDEVAERAVQLGGVALGTARVAAAHSTLPEYPLDIKNGIDHVEALSTALAHAGKLVRAGIDASAEIGDADTADLLTGVSRGLDKWLWFVEAHAGAKS